MSRRILIVDDDDAVRIAIRALLLRHGHEASCAKNGKEGLEMIGVLEPDLVICDIIMPDKEGIETILDIKRLYSAIKIVAISGGGRMSSHWVLELATECGADETLAKPFSSEDFIVAVHRQLNGTTVANNAISADNASRGS
jgi:CheY-like chemotaxis protein